MIISHDKVKIMQVCLFLIKNHNYRFITMKQNEDEIWLANEANVNFPIIRVTTATCQSVYFDKNRLLQLHHSVCKVIKREGKLLDIHLSDEKTFESDDDLEVVIMSNEGILGNDIAFQFPNIAKSLYNFTDANEEYNVIIRDLEQYQADRKKQKRKLKRKFELNSTTIIMMVCVFMFVVIAIVASIYNNTIAASIVFGAYYKAIIVVQKEYFRFFTSGFIHIDLIHLLMNLMSFYYIGNLCEKIFGVKKYLVILFSSIILGSVVTYLVTPNSLAVGLSGGIYGLMGAFFVYAYTVGMYKSPAFRSQLINILIINLLISLMPGIGLFAHLGGLLCGILLAFVMIDYEPWRQLRKHSALAIGFMFTILAVKTYMVEEFSPFYIQTDIDVTNLLDELNMDEYSNRLYENLETYYIENGGFDQ